MSYIYSEHRPFVFTEEGQVMLLAIRDKAKELIALAGCVMSGKLFVGSGDTWHMMACWDRLIELGELREVEQASSWVAGQHRIFVSSRPLVPSPVVRGKSYAGRTPTTGGTSRNRTMSSIVYRINNLGDLADHFASMIPHVQRAIDATLVQREQQLLRRELATLQMVVNTIRNTVLEPKEDTHAV